MADYFQIDTLSPYMLFTAYVQPHLKYQDDKLIIDNELWQYLAQNRSPFPAVTHVDYSSRLQSVDSDTNPAFYEILKAFESLTGLGMVLNTSFNMNDEPIVCSPDDAWRCFLRAGLDVLVMGSFLVFRDEQAAYLNDPSWENILNNFDAI